MDGTTARVGGADRLVRHEMPQEILHVFHAADDVIRGRRCARDSACAAARRTMSRTMSVVALTGMPTTRTRGTITCHALRSPNSNSSQFRILPGLAAQQAALLALLDDQLQFFGRVVRSSSETSPLTPTARRTTLPDAVQRTHERQQGEPAAPRSAERPRARVRVAPCSASVLGTISPSTMWTYVSSATAAMLATVFAVIQLGDREGTEPLLEIQNATTCSPALCRDRGSASDTPIWVVAM